MDLRLAVLCMSICSLLQLGISASKPKKMSVLMIRAVYTDAGEQGMDTVQQIYDTLYVSTKEEDSFRQIIAHASSGQLLCEPEDGKIITVNMNSRWNSQENQDCKTGKIIPAVVKKVKEQHPDVDPDGYTVREVFLPNTPWTKNCPFSGIAHPSVGRCHPDRLPNVGKCSAMYAQMSNVGRKVRAHEIGHLLGLWHAGGHYANTWKLRKETEMHEGGDPQTIMGRRMGTYTPPELLQLGFISELDGQVKTWTPQLQQPLTLVSVDSSYADKNANEYIGIRFACDACISKRERWAWINGGHIWVSFRGSEDASVIREDVGAQWRRKVFVHYARAVRSNFQNQGTELWAELAEGSSAKVHEMPYVVRFCAMKTKGNRDLAEITIAATETAAKKLCQSSISGPTEKPECIVTNAKYTPLDMQGQSRSTESSAENCQRRCASVSGCAHFSWWTDGGCHLQDESAVKASNNWGVSKAGPPTCRDVASSGTTAISSTTTSIIATTTSTTTSIIATTTSATTRMTTSTTPGAPIGECKPFCARRKDKAWWDFGARQSVPKCTWKGCSGCPECQMPPNNGCIEWCYANKKAQKNPDWSCSVFKGCSNCEFCGGTEVQTLSDDYTYEIYFAEVSNFYLDAPGELEATMALEGLATNTSLDTSSNSSDSGFLAAAGNLKQNAMLLFAILVVSWPI